MSKSPENTAIAMYALGAVLLVVGIAVFGLLGTFAPTADVAARSKGIVVMLSDIPEGEHVMVKLPGQPVFVRHRTATEIAEAEAVALSDLRDQSTVDTYGRRIGDARDLTRRATPDGRFIAVVGIADRCTVAVGAGEFNGWYDICRGGHFDLSGRIRIGPAVGNLPLPSFRLIDKDRLVLFPPDPNIVPQQVLENVGL